MVKADLLLQNGACCFIPFAQGLGQTVPFTYAGQTINVLQQDDELPGFLGYFTPTGSSGMVDTSDLENIDAGENPTV